jgi:hypothetical protein
MTRPVHRSRTVLGATIGLALCAGLLLPACSSEDDRFSVVVAVLADDDSPMPNVLVKIGPEVTGKTEVDGKFQTRLTGKEGQNLKVTVEPPKGYRLISEGKPLVLRHLNAIEGSSSAPLPVEYTAKVAPLERQYAILVRAGIPNLPVEVFGSQRAVTNELGTAAFLHTGTPGDELKVRLVTSGRPDLRPQNPSATVTLAPHADAYVVKEKFAVIPKKRAPVHRIVRLAPHRF